MKKILSKSFYFVILFAIILTFSCKKTYPEGPRLTFRSISHRMIGSWGVVEFNANGVDSLKYYNDSVGAVMRVYYVEGVLSDYVVRFEHGKIDFDGEFNFNDEYDRLYVKIGSDYHTNKGIGPVGVDKKSIWQILKLTNKKLKISSDFNGINYIISFNKLTR